MCVGEVLGGTLPVHLWNSRYKRNMQKAIQTEAKHCFLVFTSHSQEINIQKIRNVI
jgi:hypothetical protein